MHGPDGAARRTWLQRYDGRDRQDGKHWTNGKGRYRTNGTAFLRGGPNRGARKHWSARRRIHRHWTDRSNWINGHSGGYRRDRSHWKPWSGVDNPWAHRNDRRHRKRLVCHWAYWSDGQTGCRFYGDGSDWKRRIWI